MTKPPLILGIAAAFVLSVLPLAASAGAAHGGHRPAHWQRAHDGQGVVRVVGGDIYRPPEAYRGGEFRGGLDVRTDEDHFDYDDRRHVGPYAPPPPAGCGSVCVVSDGPPPAYLDRPYHSDRDHGRDAYYEDDRHDIRERQRHRHHDHRQVRDCTCGHDGYVEGHYYESETYRDSHGREYRRDVFGRY